MGRLRRGWRLTKKSWGVLRENRALFRFPLYGALAMLPLVAITILPGFYLIDEDELLVGLPVAALGFYLLAFIGIYFSVGLAATADKLFRGEQATVSDGLAVARANLRPIAGWALVSAALSVLFNLLEEKAGFLGEIGGAILEVGWALVTFLAVPVIAIEGTGPVETVKRSGSLFRSRWGEQVSGNLAIGGAALLFGVLPGIALIVLGILLWSTSGFGGAALLVAGIAVIAISLLFQKALSGIFGVALYRFAADGSTLAGFTAEELDSAVDRGTGAGTQATV